MQKTIERLEMSDFKPKQNMFSFVSVSVFVIMKALPCGNLWIAARRFFF